METKTQLNLYILEKYRDLLQRMAAERMLGNPKRSVTASRIGAEILCEYLENLGKKGITDLAGGVQND
jgi:hypothetical protein